MLGRVGVLVVVVATLGCERKVAPDARDQPKLGDAGPVCVAAPGQECPPVRSECSEGCPPDQMCISGECMTRQRWDEMRGPYSCPNGCPPGQTCTFGNRCVSWDEYNRVMIRHHAVLPTTAPRPAASMPATISCSPEPSKPYDCKEPCKSGFVCRNGQCMSFRYYDCIRRLGEPLYWPKGTTQPASCGSPTEE